jgi:hypothetical protein
MGKARVKARMSATPPLLETNSGKLQRQNAIEDMSAIENVPVGNKDC